MLVFFLFSSNMEDFYFSLMEELTTMKINLAIEYVFSLSGS